MDLKERIKVALGLNDESEVTKEVNLMYEDKLADGTIVVSEADELAAGVLLNILSEDGVQTPLPEGNYSLESGVTFSVDAEGIVTEVNEAEESEEVEEPVEEVEMSNEEAILLEVGTVVKELLEEVRNDISRLTAELDEVRGLNLSKDENIAELLDENTKLSAQVKELNESPATEPLKVSKFNSVKKEVTPTEYEKMTARQKYMYNFNKNN
jgi:vacuolar-type H+-ATPase subunit I/STV1